MRNGGSHAVARHPAHDQLAMVVRIAPTVYRADASARLVREPESLDGEDVLPGLTVSLTDLFA